MTIRWGKYPLLARISKQVLYNSQKNATIKKEVFQNGLRLVNGAFCEEFIFRESSSRLPLKKKTIYCGDSTDMGTSMGLTLGMRASKKLS